MKISNTFCTVASRPLPKGPLPLTLPRVAWARKVLLIFIGALSITSLHAQEVFSSFGLDQKDAKAVKEIRYKMAQIRKTRPTVGLVLSGGGAKGAATCGVLKYLEECDIPIDMVVGTSIGGLIGGFYAMGYDADYLADMIQNMDWDMALSDKVDQKYIPYSRTRYREKFLLSFPFYYSNDDYENFLAGDAPFADGRNRTIHIGAGKKKGSISDMAKENILGSLPSGFVFGQNVNQVITSRSVGYSDSTNFFKFPIPFACVATDVASGRAKIWHEGSVNLAMRSTMSIPGLFAPVRTGGMVLVDGGMRNNYPVNIAREMGADIIIGVNLSNESSSADDIKNLADILWSSVDLMSNDIFEQNVKSVDVDIHPDVSGYGMLSFNDEAIDTLFVRGYKAAQAIGPQLQAVKKRLGRAHLTKNGRGAVDIGRTPVLIGEIAVEGVSATEADYIMDKMKVKSGMRVGKQDIEDDVARIFGKGAYDYVNYELRGTAEPYKLRIYCKRGPMHQLGLSARIDSQDLVSLLLNVGFNTHAMSGHALDITARVSSNPYLDAIYSFTAPKAPTVNARAFLRYADTNHFYYEDSRFGISYFLATQEVYFSNIRWSTMDLKFGARNQFFRFENVMGTAISSDYSSSLLAMDYAGLFVNARVETLDNGYFPHKGVSAGIGLDTITLVGGREESPDSWGHIYASDGRFPATFGKVTLVPGYYVRFLWGKSIPPFYYNVMGGDFSGRYIEQQIPFIGISNAAFCRNFLAVGGLEARYEVAPDHHLFAIGNLAFDCDNFQSVGEGSATLGLGAGYGYNSIFGPIKAQIYWSTFSKRLGAYVSLGYNF